MSGLGELRLTPRCEGGLLKMRKDNEYIQKYTNKLVFVCIYIHACIQACVYIYIYACMHTHIYIYAYIEIDS